MPVFVPLVPLTDWHHSYNYFHLSPLDISISQAGLNCRLQPSQWFTTDKGSLSKNTDMSYSSWPWRLTIALCPLRTEYRLKNNLQIWTCLSELCYQIPQLCKCKCCEVSWNWLNCRVIMFCTPVRDYLTGGLPKQLLDKLVLNRCPKLILQVWKFVEKGGNDKTETKVGFLYIFGSRGRKGHQRIWVIHTFFILQSSLLFLVWQLSGQSAKLPRLL